jgi:P pilus assembly chaperone PapD
MLASSRRIPNSRTTRLVAASLTCCFAAATLGAQAASVSPQAILITNESRVGTLHVLNPYTEPLEIVVDLRYGFVATDSAGRTVVELPADSVRAPNSAVPLLRVTPARFVLPPGDVQLVRIAAFAPRDLPTGEYWARIGVQALPAATRSSRDTAGITVGVGVQVKTVLPVFYRHHSVATSVALAPIAPTRTGDSLVVRPMFTRGGSGAALLAVETVVSDASGGVLVRSVRQAAVYHSLSPRYVLPLTAEQWSRAAQVRVSATSQRPDLPAGLPLPVLPVSRVASLRAP